MFTLTYPGDCQSAGMEKLLREIMNGETIQSYIIECFIYNILSWRKVKMKILLEHGSNLDLGILDLLIVHGQAASLIQGCGQIGFHHLVYTQQLEVSWNALLIGSFHIKPSKKSGIPDMIA